MPIDHRTSIEHHHRFMREALALAETAAEQGEIPVGAVVVRGTEIIGSGWNRNRADQDPTAHAEIVALREAAHQIGNYRLTDCDLYCTLEPCAMCAGAMVHSRIRHLIYGADDPRAGAAGSVFQITNSALLNHRVMVTAGVLNGACSDLLEVFFRNRRA